jgi:hypothetical protein
MPKVISLLFRIFAVWVATASVAPALDLSSATPALCFQEVDKAVRDLQRNYLATLKEAAKFYQQEGDLDAYLAAQEEFKRFEASKIVKPENYVSSPADLAWQQGFYYASLHNTILDITRQYTEVLLLEQRRLTQLGKIEEAIKIRTQITAIRNQYKDAFAWQANREKNPQITIIPASALIQFYHRDPVQADRLLKDKKILVEGIVADLTMDTSNGTIFHVTMQDLNTGQTRVDAQFHLDDYTVRRVPGGDRVAATFERKDSDLYLPFHLAKGDKIQVEGTLAGRHININLMKCRIPDDLWKLKTAPAATPRTP